MNCSTARELFAAARLDSDDLASADFGGDAAHADLAIHADLVAHLDACPECRVEFYAAREFDRDFAAACRAVDVPHGLKERLHAALTPRQSLPLASSAAAAFSSGEVQPSRFEGAAENGSVPRERGKTAQPDSKALPEIAEPDKTLERKKANERTRKLAPRGFWRSFAAAICLLVAFGLWWSLRTPALPTQSIAAIVEQVTSPGFQLDLQPALPPDTSARLPEQIDCHKVLHQRALNLPTNQVAGTLVVLRVPTRHGKSFEALLVVLDRRQLAAADVAAIGDSFAKASTRYLTSGDTVKAWKEGDIVYICVARKYGADGADGFEFLLPRINPA